MVRAPSRCLLSQARLLSQDRLLSQNPLFVGQSQPKNYRSVTPCVTLAPRGLSPRPLCSLRHVFTFRLERAPLGLRPLRFSSSRSAMRYRVDPPRCLAAPFHTPPCCHATVYPASLPLPRPPSASVNGRLVWFCVHQLVLAVRHSRTVPAVLFTAAPHSLFRPSRRLTCPTTLTRRHTKQWKRCDQLGCLGRWAPGPQPPSRKGSPTRVGAGMGGNLRPHRPMSASHDSVSKERTSHCLGALRAASHAAGRPRFTSAVSLRRANHAPRDISFSLATAGVPLTLRRPFPAPHASMRTSRAIRLTARTQ